MVLLLLLYNISNPQWRVVWLMVGPLNPKKKKKKRIAFYVFTISWLG